MVKEMSDEILLDTIFKHFSTKKFTSPKVISESLESYKKGGSLYGVTSGCYRYIFNGEVVYIGMSESSMKARTYSFYRNAKLVYEGLKGNEAHSRKWAHKFPIDSLSKVIVEYCPTHSYLAKSFESWLINDHKSKHGMYPILNQEVNDFLT